MYYGMRHEHLDDALQLITKAVQLDPAIMGYRMNAASVLNEMGRYDEADKVLQAALKAARESAGSRHGGEPHSTGHADTRGDDAARPHAGDGRRLGFIPGRRCQHSGPAKTPYRAAHGRKALRRWCHQERRVQLSLRA